MQPGRVAPSRGGTIADKHSLLDRPCPQSASTRNSMLFARHIASQLYSLGLHHAISWSVDCFYVVYCYFSRRLRTVRDESLRGCVLVLCADLARNNRQKLQ